jgi:hypothetical protein
MSNDTEPLLVQEPAARAVCGGMAKSTWYRYESGAKRSAGVFPRAIRLPGLPNKKFYRLTDVKSWIEAQIAEGTQFGAVGIAEPRPWLKAEQAAERG